MSSATVFMCSRRTDSARCTTASCTKLADESCQFQLGGKSAGKKCERKICGDCSNKRGLCTPHQRLTDKKTGSPRI